MALAQLALTVVLAACQQYAVPRPSRSTILAWIALAAFALGRIVGLAHVAFEEHRRCELHGDLIEIDGVRALRSFATGSRAVVFPAEPGALDHAHCPFSGVLHPQDAASIFAAEFRSDSVALVPPHTSTVDSTSIRALYRLAPKTSPPTALLSIA